MKNMAAPSAAVGWYVRMTLHTPRTKPDTAVNMPIARLQRAVT